MHCLSHNQPSSSLIFYFIPVFRLWLLICLLFAFRFFSCGYSILSYIVLLQSPIGMELYRWTHGYQCFCFFFFGFLIFQLRIFYFTPVLLQSPIVMEMKRGTHVSQSPTVRCKASRFRAMRAQPFTDKLIRNICDDFSVYLSEHLCAYLCRVIFLYICYWFPPTVENLRDQ